MMKQILVYTIVIVIAAMPAGGVLAEADADKTTKKKDATSVLDELTKKLEKRAKPPSPQPKGKDVPADAAEASTTSAADKAKPSDAVEPSERRMTGPDLAPAINVGVDPKVLGLPPGAKAPTLRREGDYVRMRRGRIVEAPDGSCAVFVFEKDATRAPAPPMVLVPSQSLQSMEDLVRKRGDRFTFTLSGQVLQYRGVNYLLPTMQRPPTAVSEPAEKKDEALPEPVVSVLQKLQGKVDRNAAAEPPAASGGGDRAPVSRRPALAVAPKRAGSAPGMRSPKLRRQGQYIRMRRGRIVRAPAADNVLFVFDSDGSALADPPVALVPCQTLESMEQQVQKLGDRTVFVLSGQVLEYRGENYLLPTMMKLAVNRGNLR